MKNWNTITIEDYQLIYGIINDSVLNDFEKEVKLISIANELSESEVDNMSLDDFKKLKHTLDFLHNGKIEGKLRQHLTINKTKYKMSLDAFKLTYGQYVDITTFMSGDNAMIENLHLIMASLSLPVKSNWYGKETVLNYGSKPHNEISKDMPHCNFADCYHTSVFFFETYKRLNKSYRGLFGASSFEREESDEREVERDTKTFSEKWGWVYNAELIAGFERIKLDDVWNINIIQALNSLAYLKDKKANENEQIEKMKR